MGCQHATCALLMARKKKDNFSQDSQTDMAGNSKREVITHKSGGHNSVSFKMNC